MNVWSSEMDNRLTDSACRRILLVCHGILPLCRGILFVCRGILLDVMTHAAVHKHENEEEWFLCQKRDTLSTAISAQLVNWQYGGKSIGKNRYSVERSGTNSSGGNEERQSEDVESVMTRLYPSGRSQGGERKRLKNVRAHAATGTKFFIRIRKISFVFVWYYVTKAATMQTAKERQCNRSFPRQT